ncbi:MAG TPA: helix-turn-helix transcriptional regulator [Ferruginibacter sp.]|jgi:transcriptional regulator with XRE-family HTH domain|nr:helix-turn-helix transcriptional regulator [Ferruginibacter sp.]
MSSPKSAIELYIIERVKERRIELKLSQADLAFKLGVSYGFIGQVESKKFPAKYNMEHLDRLAFIFKCSPKEFLPDKPFTKKID